MAWILDDDGLLDAADGFAGWDDALEDDTLAQELAQERAVELESELEQDERPIDYDAELEDAEEEAAPTSGKRLKRELRAEALRRLEDAARTAEDFAVVVEEWNKLEMCIRDRSRPMRRVHPQAASGLSDGDRRERLHPLRGRTAADLHRPGASKGLSLIHI